jgi:hypothetical protein
MTWFVVGPRWPAMTFGDLGGLVRASSQGVLVRKKDADEDCSRNKKLFRRVENVGFG